MNQLYDKCRQYENALINHEVVKTMNSLTYTKLLQKFMFSLPTSTESMTPTTILLYFYYKM